MENPFDYKTNYFADYDGEYINSEFDEAEGQMLYVFQDWLEFVKTNHPVEL